MFVLKSAQTFFIRSHVYTFCKSGHYTLLKFLKLVAGNIPSDNCTVPKKKGYIVVHLHLNIHTYLVYSEIIKKNIGLTRLRHLFWTLPRAHQHSFLVFICLIQLKQSKQKSQNKTTLPTFCPKRDLQKFFFFNSMVSTNLFVARCFCLCKPRG